MRKSILLVLLYLLIQTIAGSILSLIVSQSPDVNREFAIIIALLVSDVIMTVILIQQGYLSDKRLIHPTTAMFLSWTFIAGISAIFISDTISTMTDFMPNWLESSFTNMEGTQLGVLAIAIVGPILEEMLFRGAITSVLLKTHTPKKAIIYSALIFGIFHINPAQILTAFLLGLLLAWLFYKTHSLIPGILIHILNNSLSVYFSRTYPEANTLADIMGSTPYYICFALAVLLVVASIWQLNKKKG